MDHNTVTIKVISEHKKLTEIKFQAKNEQELIVKFNQIKIGNDINNNLKKLIKDCKSFQDIYELFQ